MQERTLKVTAFAHGGAGIARGKDGRPIFIPGTIPGETVKAAITQDKGRFQRAELLHVIKASPDRTQPRCPHFGVCGGCHYQHIAYRKQLAAKREVVQDQLKRIGRLKKARVRPVLAHPRPYGYAGETSFSPTAEGPLGYWAPKERRVIPIKTCPILDATLLNLFQDVDLELPGLRKLTLRLGVENSMLAALEVDDVEPPEMEVDFPLSVAIVLPDRTAASLIGDPFLIQEVKGRQFRVSPGCFFQPSVAAAEMIVDTVLSFASLTGRESILELYSGVGMLTAFLAEGAREVTTVEVNEDAIADLAVNLDHLDNVGAYVGLVEEIVPSLDIQPNILVVDPGSNGLPSAVIKRFKGPATPRLIYVSSDVSTLARDSRALSGAGYRLVEVQPIDARPQTYHVDTVSLWTKR